MNMINEIINNNSELQFIPIRQDKSPIPIGWQKNNKKYNFFQENGLGLVCGEISGNVEVIDFDLKYDLTGSLYARFLEALNSIDDSIYGKMVIQKTRSGGYHFIYRCSKIEGNKKLARRESNEAEKSDGEKIKVLIETRGEGGFVACWPTDGYQLIQGTYNLIQQITPEERDILFSIAREFNEYVEEYKFTVKTDTRKLEGLSPWQDYDNRGDVLRLLESHGWKAKGQKGSKTFFLRPGDSKARFSGNYDSNLNYFSVFSTSTEFEPEKGYRPSAVYAVLECNKDFSEAAKKLYSLGFGDRIEKNKKSDKPVEMESKPIGGDIKRLSQFLDKMLYEYDNGKPKGEDPRIEVIKPIFSWLKTEVTVVTGYPNHGKSELTLFMMMVKSVVDGWRWAIFCPENMPANMFFDSLINTFIGKPVDKTRNNHMSKDEYLEGAKFINEHFVIIEPEQDYTLENILKNFEHLIKTERIDGVMIDPWNQLAHDFISREDQYLSNKLNLVKQFAKSHKIIFIIIAHPKTLMRNKDGEYPAPDDKSISGGIIWPAKADNVLIVHRPFYATDITATDVDLTSKKIKKQKLVGIPGTVRLKYDRFRNRYTSVQGESLFPVTLKSKEEKSINSFPAQADLNNWETLPKIHEGGDEIAPF